VFFCSNYKDVNHLFILRHVAQVCGFKCVFFINISLAPMSLR
jgi:hypothetical protein